MSKSPVGKSLFGIELGARCLKGIVIQRVGSQFHIHKSFHVPLTLDPLTSAPELLGREIRNHLNNAGIHENRCILCIPLKWAMFLQTEMPDLSDADTVDYIKVQAEHEFPFSPEDLVLSSSKYQISDGVSHATIAAIPSGHLSQLQKVFKAAGLRTTAITFGITSLFDSIEEVKTNSISIYVDEDAIEMKVVLGGGIAALRLIEDLSEVDPAERDFDPALIANQIRISLGQLPNDSRNQIHTVRIYGSPSLVASLQEAIQGAVERMGMRVEIGTTSYIKQIITVDTGKSFSFPVLFTIAKQVMGLKYDFEFSLPQTSRLKQLSGLITSQRIVWAGGGGVGLILITITAFILQYWQLSNLETSWNSIKGKVADIEVLQKQNKKFQPWFDQSAPTLEILKTLAETFPEEGSVWIKSIGIKEYSSITCTGFARNYPELQKLKEQLYERKKSIGELNLGQVGESKGQGKSQAKSDAPLQFSFTFQWEGSNNGN